MLNTYQNVAGKELFQFLVVCNRKSTIGHLIAIRVCWQRVTERFRGALERKTRAPIALEAATQRVKLCPDCYNYNYNMF